MSLRPIFAETRTTRLVPRDKGRLRTEETEETTGTISTHAYAKGGLYIFATDEVEDW